MIVLLVFLVVALTAFTLVRLRALGRERLALLDKIESLEAAVDHQSDHLHHVHEDVVVVTHAVVERGLADEEDLDEIRRRVVDEPIRRAEEREALLGSAGTADEVVIVDDGDLGHTVH